MGNQEQSINLKDLFSIEGKVALVTGGSRGIGLMIARGYVEAGVKVYISSRKKETCDRAAEELSRVGQCFSIPADLSTTQGCKHLADELSAREPSLHILVNNAGAAWGAPLEEYPESGFDKVMDTNVKGVFFLTQYLLPLLERAARPEDPARVINIGSIDGIKVPFIENYAYAPSKAAVHHLTHVLAVKLGERGITVNAVAPGPFESQMTKWLLENHKGSIEASCPLKRIGSPNDMAGIAIFLASRAGAYINGVVIPVDGGICLK
jgi:NAD(P)-dependent dehydrogenase (short-subunit alcohol dehydrogenase family)